MSCVVVPFFAAAEGVCFFLGERGMQKMGVFKSASSSFFFRSVKASSVMFCVRCSCGLSS